MLGPFGLMLQEFYLNNSLAINSVIVIYGLFLVVCNLNYKKILEAAIEQVGKKTGSNKNTKNKSRKISWAQAIEDGSFFPFIAGTLNIFPRKATVIKIEELTKKDKRWQRIMKNTRSGKAK